MPPATATQEGGGREPEGDATGVEATGGIAARGQALCLSSKSASRRAEARAFGGGKKQLPLGEAAGRGPLSAHASRVPETLSARPRDDVL